MPEPSPAQPLAGLVVADLSTVLAGPLCTMVLADLGADVVKVEPPAGDPTRAWGPPWVGSADDGTLTAAYFLSVNRNKRSLRLDLRSPHGGGVLRRLLSRADVLVENLRPGGLDRLGFGDEVLGQLNPRLVHLAIGGYGATGPDARRPGYDFAVQAESGLMSITGFPDEEGGAPTKVGVAIADVVTGLFGAVGVLATLVGRARGSEGAREGGDRGRRGEAGTGRVDVSILESTLAALVNQAQNAFVTGQSPGRLGNAHPNIVPYEAFGTADGQLVLAVGSERQWQALGPAIGLAGLAGDPRFATNGDRVVHRAELRGLLEARFATASTAAWLAALTEAEIPCAPINDVLGAFATPQATALGMRVAADHPVLGAVDQVRSAITLGGETAAVRRLPPLLGEHSDEILRELGLDEAEIATLRTAGVT